MQRKLGCPRTSLGSLCEATSVFDAERLKDIIDELGGQLQPLAQDRRLQDIGQTITLVDGSLIAALPKIMEASRQKAETGSGLVKWRLHTHSEILRGIPRSRDHSLMYRSSAVRVALRASAQSERVGLSLQSCSKVSSASVSSFSAES